MPTIATGVRELRSIDSKSVASGLAISPDGTLISGACSDGYFRIWNLADGSLKSEIKSPGDEPFRVAFSPDGSFLAGGGSRKSDAI